MNHTYEATYEDISPDGTVRVSAEIRITYTVNWGCPARIHYDEHDHPAEGDELEITKFEIDGSSFSFHSKKTRFPALSITGVISTPAYDDFELRVEFWASDDANSGIFMRCQDANTITDRSCYEANIFDQRGDLSFGTGGVVHIAPVSEPYPKAGGRWNTYEITLQGSRMTLVLNGETTAEAEDSQFSSGPIALQWGRGTLRFRSMQIRPL